MFSSLRPLVHPMCKLSEVSSLIAINCVAPKKTHSPPPNGGHFCHTPPTPGISIIFQLGWVPPGKTICVKNAVAQYFYVKDNCFCDKERKKCFYLCYNLNFAL